MKKLIGVIVVVFAVAVAGFFLLGGCEGLGLGKGDGNGEGQNNTEVVSQASGTQTSEPSAAESSPESSAEESEESQILTVEITVSGRDYLYQNNKITLDDFLKELEKFEKETEVIINADSTAAKNTMDDLTDKLDAAGYKNYHKKTAQ